MKAASIVGSLGVLGLLGVTVPTTIQLTRLDAGLSSSLQSTSKLVSIESAIIQKNKSLQTLIDTTAMMSRKLQSTAATTSELQKNIDRINQLNQETLHVNQSIGTQAQSGSGNLTKIVASLHQLDGSMTQLNQSLSSLDAIVRQDANNMDQMKQATDSMNSKVPGVTG